jgi:PST family polysaccharide transporter
MPHSAQTSNLSTSLEAADCDATGSTSRSSYKEILRSSVMIGGASAIGLAIGLLRTKAMALILGPAGLGLMAALTAIADLVRSVAEMGINNSGVRQIAASAASADSARIALTAMVLRRVAILLGLAGAALLALASPLVARVTFGDEHYAPALAIVSLAVALRLVSDGQSALLQGLRRIGELARANIYGSVLGVIGSVALVYRFGEEGVAPALVAIALGSLLVSWWYSRRAAPMEIDAAWRDLAQEGRALLRLGVAFMATGMTMMGTTYLVRMMLIRQGGLEAAGLYQSAWSVGGVYVGFVLQAMGTDFYPRLVGTVDDHARCNRLVNEQAQVSLLLAGPGVVGTIVLAPIVLTLLYSTHFTMAAEALRWICLGMALRVVTWPIGYIIVARGARGLFVLTELAWAGANLLLSWMLIQRYGPQGAGAAFFASYVFHGLLIYPIVRRLSGFRWARATVRAGLVCLVCVALAFVSEQWLKPEAGRWLGVLALVSSSLYSLIVLARLAPTTAFARAARMALRPLFRVARAPASASAATKAPSPAGAHGTRQ